VPNPNLELLRRAATLLKPLLDELVFVGGCTTGLLITDEAAADVRPTYDVDVIAEITSYADYAVFSEKLRRLKFTEDNSEGAPICRWQSGNLKLDVMPLDENILGFSNRWYRAALDNAQVHELDADLRIRAITSPFFLATKLEAYRGRGGGDIFGSHDLEDIVSVVDGRACIVEDLKGSPEDVRLYVGEQVKSLLADPQFADALSGYLLPDAASQARLPLLLKRLNELADLRHE
jgi:hypothetical protein